MKINLDITKKYIFLDEIKIIKYKKFFLIISPLNAKWLVAKSQVQVDFFNCLLTNSIQNALENFPSETELCKDILIQIEAKDFCIPSVVSAPHKKIQLHLTNKCNLSCPHCYMNAGKENENELSTQEILDLLAGFSNFGFNQLTLTGGEVCTRSDLLKIAKTAHSLNYRISILTNGTLWEENQITEISKYISQVQISIDGFSENTNAKIRGKGSFEKALTATDFFIKNNVRVCIAITPVEIFSAPSCKIHYAEFAKNLVQKYKDSKIFSIMFNGDIMDGRNIKYTKKQKANHLEQVGEIYHLTFGENSEEISFIEQNNKNKISENCAYGSITISSNGNIYFCSKLINQASPLNVRSTNIKEIADLSEKISKASEIKNIITCNKCELRNICGGDCRAIYVDVLKNTSDFSFINKKLNRSPCTKEYKEEFYKLMVNTNKYLYK